MSIRPLLLIIAGISFAFTLNAVANMENVTKTKVSETGLFYSEVSKKFEEKTITTDLGERRAVE